MGMIPVKITSSRYDELWAELSDPTLGTEIQAFRRAYRCNDCRSWVNDEVTLYFDDEKDAMLFILKV